jgi:hypothetical protein
MTSGGSIAWAREFVGRLGEDRAGALTVDRQGNCYVTGVSPSVVAWLGEFGIS